MSSIGGSPNIAIGIPACRSVATNGPAASCISNIVQGLRLHDHEMTSAGADEIAKGDELIHQNLR